MRTGLSQGEMKPLLASENGRHFAEPQLVPVQITSEDSIQKFLTRHYPDMSCASDWLKQISLAARPIRKHYPDVGSDTSSVWNFFACSSDVIWRENQRFSDKPCTNLKDLVFFQRPHQIGHNCSTPRSVINKSL